MEIINKLGILGASKKQAEEREQRHKEYKDSLQRFLDYCLKHTEQTKNILGTCDFMSEHGLNGRVPFIKLNSGINPFISCKTDKINHTNMFTAIKFQREYEGIIMNEILTVLFNPFQKTLTIECSGSTNDCIKVIKINNNDYQFENFSIATYLRIFDSRKIRDIENFTKNLKQYLNLMVKQINEIN